MTIIRTAIINHPEDRQPRLETVQRYLPSNYQATVLTDNTIQIVGTDQHGWTLDGYVIPRLSSGLIRAVEGVAIEVPPLVIDVVYGEVTRIRAVVGDLDIPVAAVVSSRYVPDAGDDHDRTYIV